MSRTPLAILGHLAPISDPPTERQIQILALIQSNVAERGFPPTLREMADALGVSQTAVNGTVIALIRRSLLTQQPRIPRSFVITEAGYAALGAR